MERHAQRFKNNAGECRRGWRGKSRGLGSMIESVEEGCERGWEAQSEVQDQCFSVRRKVGGVCRINV